MRHNGEWIEFFRDGLDVRRLFHFSYHWDQIPYKDFEEGKIYAGLWFYRVQPWLLSPMILGRMPWW